MSEKELSFSYVMMAFNEQDHIKDAIDSVLAQGEGIELLVVDDGSTDNTPIILRENYECRPNVKLLFPGHIGKNAAANLGVSSSEGNWICLVAADDLLVEGAKDAIAKAVVGSNPLDAKTAVFSSLEMFSEDKKYDGVRLPRNPNRVNKTGSYAYMSRALVEDMFPIPEDYPNEDGWSGLYYKYLLENQISVYEVLAFYRIHSGNSLNKDADYSCFNEAYHARATIVKPFLERYSVRLNDEQIKSLNDDLEAEELRYQGRTLRLLLRPNKSIVTWARRVVLSNKNLYSLKLALNRYLLGH